MGPHFVVGRMRKPPPAFLAPPRQSGRSSGHKQAARSGGKATKTPGEAPSEPGKAGRKSESCEEMLKREVPAFRGATPTKTNFFNDKWS
eukprot:7475160-Pyramimonas_sp.AAC.1